MTVQKLREFKERDLSKIVPFAVFPGEYSIRPEAKKGTYYEK